MEQRFRRGSAPGSAVTFTTGRQRAALAAAALLVLSVCAVGAAHAATCTSTGTGNWSSPAIWSGCGGGVPGAADVVIIANLNHTVTVDSNRSASVVTFAAGGNYSNLTLVNGVTLGVANTMTVSGATGGAGTRRVTVGVNSVLNVGGDLIMNGGSSNTRDTELLIANGAASAVNVAGDFGATAGGGNFNSTVRMIIRFSGSGTLSVGNNFGGNATLASGTGTIVFNGTGAQRIPSYSAAGSNYHNITINKAVGTATLAGNIRVRGDFSNSATARFSAGNCTTQVRTVTFQGAVAQNLTGAATATNFCRVAINNANDLVLAHDLNIVNTANGLLTLTTGNIVTGANEAVIGNGSAIASAGGNDFVIGNLTKAFTTGASVSRTFEVGTATGGSKYAPVTLVFASVSAGGSLTVSTVGTDHPDIAASDLNDTLSVNRYWTISNGGVAFTTYSSTFTFVNPGDLDTGVDPLVFIAQLRSPPSPAAGSWNDTTVGTRTATTHQVTGETGFGDFAIGTRVGVSPGIGRFNAYDTATPPGQVTGVIQTKIAGAPINVDLVALNAAGTAIQTGFTGMVVVQLLDASDDSGALDADACRPSWPVLQTISPNPAFTAPDFGRIAVAFTENNAWPVARIRVSNVAGTRIGCSTDAFAIRPNAFANLSVSHGDWEYPGATAFANTAFAAGELHKAGRSFRIVANAVNGAGSPAITTNYTGSPPTVLAACGGAACTSTFGTVTLGGSFVAGQLASDSATYSEVGAFNLQLVDSTFADIDSSDGTPADCSATGRYVCSGTVTVGRFVPDHFAVAVTTAPVFGTGCGAGSFTYVGQKFSYTLQPVATVTAQDFGNNTTALYAGSWWRISNTDLTPATQAARYSAVVGTLDVSGLPAVSADPAIVPGSPAAGQGTLTFSSGTGLRFTRTSPASPYDADIGIAINVADADGVVYAGNPMNVGLAAAGSGIAFNNGKEMRFGRLFATSARGSALVPLSLRLELQYWNGTAFVTNIADTCTTISANNIEMTNFSQNLDLCETSLTVNAFAKGRATARLSKPGGPHAGSVTLVPRLEQTPGGSPQTCIAGAATAVVGANLPYLEGKWDVIDEGADGKLYDDNPAARGTFGVYPGTGEVIDLRENF